MNSGIPTKHAGTRFRSRLEARWAAFFDLLDWPWEYEPIDLNGYIPDFVLPFDHKPLLVEVKPEFSLGSLQAHASKIETSGWNYDGIIVGATLLGTGNSGEPDVIAGLISQRECWGGPRCADWSWQQGDLIRCAECARIGIYSPIYGWYCYRCGAVGKVYNGHWKHGWPDFELLWREAGNRTQWRPR